MDNLNRLTFFQIIIVLLFGLLVFNCMDWLSNSSKEDNPFSRNVIFSDSEQPANTEAKVLAVLSYEDSIPDTVLDASHKKGAAALLKTTKKKAVQVNDTLLLISQVSPPKLDGKTLQASDFKKTGNTLYVSYNMKGGEFLGAVQVIDIHKPEHPILVQTVKFQDSDIHSLEIKGSSLYLAGATGNARFQSPAFVEIVQLKNSIIPEEYVSQIIDLPSFAATSVIKVKGMIAVSVGNSGGGVMFIGSSENIKSGYNSYQDLDATLNELDDARYLDYSSSRIVCVKGTPGGLWAYNRETGQSSIQVLSGATTAESKSTVELSGNIALLTLGEGGLTLFDIQANKPMINLPQAEKNGLPKEKTVTNAASGRYKEFYTADGEAGARVFINQDDKPVKLASFETESGQSVNAVRYHSKHLIMATGLGGVHIALMKRSNKWVSEDEDDYWEKREKEREEDDD